MNTEPTITASTFLSAFKILTENGMDAAKLEKKAGLTSQNLENPDIRIPVTKQNEYSITEIAFLLGFSENSSFNRAFNRWYDRNPSEFRK